MNKKPLNRIDKVAVVLFTMGLIFAFLAALTLVAALGSFGASEQDKNVIDITPNKNYENHVYNYFESLFGFAGFFTNIEKLHEVAYADDVVLQNNNGDTEPSQNQENSVNPDECVEMTTDIFKLEYSKDGQLIAKSQDNQAIVAPGLQEEGSIYLKNTSSRPIRSECKFWLEDGSTIVPLKCKLIAPNGHYLVGSPSEYVDSKNIDTSEIYQLDLEPGGVACFSFPWMWPWDEDNERDTYLGQAASFDNITFQIKLEVMSNYTDEDSNSENADGNKPTGDKFPLFTILIILALVCIISAICLVIYSRKRKSNKNKASAKHVVSPPNNDTNNINLDDGNDNL